MVRFSALLFHIAAFAVIAVCLASPAADKPHSSPSEVKDIAHEVAKEVAKEVAAKPAAVQPVLVAERPVAVAAPVVRVPAYYRMYGYGYPVAYSYAAAYRPAYYYGGYYGYPYHSYSYYVRPYAYGYYYG